MKVISKGKRYMCPECGTVVEITNYDIWHWNSISYYTCPECYEHLIINKGTMLDRILKPYGLDKQAIPM